MSGWRQNLQIIKQLTITDYKLRYSGSVLGYLWSLLKPLIFFVVLYVVFAKFLRLDGGIKNFSIYLLIGIIFWTFFCEATNNGLHAVVDKAGMIKKIYFPRIIVVIVANVNALINLFFNLLVLFVLMMILKIDVFTGKTILLLFYILEMWLLSFGLSLILATLFVWWRDLSHIWELVLQVFFYLTPLIYPLSFVPEKYYAFLMINPLAQIITDIRSLFIEFNFQILPYYPWQQLAIVLIVLIAGLYLFQSKQKLFVEEI